MIRSPISNFSTFCYLLAAVCLLLAKPLIAEPRVWTSNDGQHITATLTHLENDTITLTLENGQKYTLPLTRLSEKDQASARKSWEETQGANESEPSVKMNPLPVFDLFRFNSSYNEVATTLKNSPKFHTTMPDAMLGRVGLNGFYKIELGQTEYSLYFKFDDSDQLQEVSLRSEEFELNQYDSKLMSSWSQLRQSVILVLKESNRSTGLPPLEQIDEGASMSSDIWKHNARHYYLMVGKINGKVACELKCSANSLD